MLVAESGRRVVENVLVIVPTTLEEVDVRVRVVVGLPAGAVDMSFSTVVKVTPGADVALPAGAVVGTEADADSQGAMTHCNASAVSIYFPFCDVGVNASV